MTACIDPGKGEYRLARADPKVRLADYAKALRFWLSYADDRIGDILFIENSNYPLDSLRDIAASSNPRGKRVEFVSLDCNWYPPGGHYGYAELRMLDLALPLSRLRQTTTHMIKVSGRLVFPRLTRLLNRLPARFDAVVDTRNWRTPFRRLNQPNVTTQIILFSHEFYERRLQRCYLELEGGPESHMETIFYRKLVSLQGNERIVLRFPCNVSPVGFPAHRNRSYTHPTQRLIDGIRAMARRVAPGWWI
jgi:hypothetical protein